MTVVSRVQLAVFNEVTEEVPQPGTAPNTWTLAQTPVGTPRLYSNGVRQKLGLDYTIEGAVLTSTFWAAQGGNLLADYSY